MSAPLVEVRGIRKEFRGQDGTRTVAVDDVSFEIARGETFGLAGMSASGKSVVGRIVMNLIEPTAGEVVFEGRSITRLGRRQMAPVRAEMQIVFQNPLASLNPRRTARASLELPLITFGYGDARKRRRRVAELLDLVGLSSRHAQYYPHEFSGGQCQRLGIARALATNPKFIFLDEPVSALDVSIQAQILNLLKELQASLGLTYLFVANNLNVLPMTSCGPMACSDPMGSATPAISTTRRSTSGSPSTSNRPPRPMPWPRRGRYSTTSASRRTSSPCASTRCRSSDIPRSAIFSARRTS